MAIVHADWFGVFFESFSCNEMTWNMWRLPWKCVLEYIGIAAWCPKSWQIWHRLKIYTWFGIFNHPCWYAGDYINVDFLPHAPETLLFITAKRCETAIILQRCVDRAVCPTKMQSDVDVMFGYVGLPGWYVGGGMCLFFCQCLGWTRGSWMFMVQWVSKGWRLAAKDMFHATHWCSHSDDLNSKWCSKEWNDSTIYVPWFFWHFLPANCFFVSMVYFFRSSSNIFLVTLWYLFFLKS